MWGGGLARGKVSTGWAGFGLMVVMVGVLGVVVKELVAYKLSGVVVW